jgi:hypothetical protein
MAAASKSDKVPQAMQEKFDRITAITDSFAAAHLNEEYAELIRFATAALCRKRPSPLAKGHDKTWACAISHAIGMANFLFDKSFEPYLSATDLYAWFGVGQSNGQGKSKQVRDLLDIGQMSPNWTVPSRIEDNPMIWMLSVDGLIMDIRRAPLGAQIQAFAQGLIPHIPGHKEDSAELLKLLQPPTAAKGKTRAKGGKTQRKAEGGKRLYLLRVDIIDGPMSEAFVMRNPQVSRWIAIRGDQTLAMLHQAIFTAFGREDEHLYEFQVKGRGPNDPEADRYVLSSALEDNDGPKPKGDVAAVAIADLDLAFGESWGYWFDFGDDWWHHIETLEVTEPEDQVKYPKLIQQVGQNPPQYGDED